MSLGTSMWANPLSKPILQEICDRPSTSIYQTHHFSRVLVACPRFSTKSRIMRKPYLLFFNIFPSKPSHTLYTYPTFSYFFKTFHSPFSLDISSVFSFTLMYFILVFFHFCVPIGIYSLYLEWGKMKKKILRIQFSHGCPERWIEMFPLIKRTQIG